MKQISILVISSKYPPEYAGSGLRAHRTYKRLAEKFNLNFDVLCSSITSNKNCEYIYEDIKVTRIANKLIPQPSLQQWEKKSIVNKIALRINYFSEVLPTLRYLYKNHHNYDLVHIFGNVAVTSAAISFCNLIKKPLIVELTYDAERPQQYKPFLIKIIDRDRSGFHPDTLIVCISKRLEQKCNKTGVYQNIWTRPNPIDTSIFCPDRIHKCDYRQKNSKFNKEDIVLVNIAKFMPIKNQIFLIEVLRLLPEKYKLFLGGPIVKEGPNYRRDNYFLKEINNKIQKYQLQNRIQIITDYIKNVSQYIKMSDVYVLPSQTEGLGTPMIESICCGIPVVATRIEGVTDTWLEEDENGLLSNLEPKEFAQKIQLAVKIDNDTLDRKSEELISVASTDFIDTRYYEIIKKLIDKNN